MIDQSKITATTAAAALTAHSALSTMDALMRRDVARGLSQSPRQLPSWLLYDDLGSALFEAICELPWYRVTRAERGLLRRHARAIVAAAGRPTRLVELGAGSGDKLATLIEEGWAAVPPLAVELVDVSERALQASRQRLSVFDEIDLVTWPLAYERALPELAHSPDASRRTMMLFLGSNVGNFDPPDAERLLRQAWAALAPGDTLLLGADLVKDEQVLHDAYDDPLGVTAAFNRNLLVRLNRELAADFDVRAFSHRAAWDPVAARIEMHLVSERQQRVRIPAADLDLMFARGESIRTEWSHKYEAAAVYALLTACGFSPCDQWVDDEARFALTLARKPV